MPSRIKGTWCFEQIRTVTMRSGTQQIIWMFNRGNAFVTYCVVNCVKLLSSVVLLRRSKNCTIFLEFSEVKVIDLATSLERAVYMKHFHRSNPNTQYLDDLKTMAKVDSY